NGYSAMFTSFVTYIGADSSVTFMDFLGHLADCMLLLGGFLIVTFAGYVWKAENLHEELAIGYEGYENSRVKLFISFAVKYLCPALLGILFIMVVLSNFFGVALIN
ncbi:MAG: sodium-dependent transporter, partial [Reichenbachiella sp.]